MNNKETNASAPAGGTGNGETRVDVERKLREYERTGDKASMADAYSTLGHLEKDVGKAIGFFQSELAILRELGSDRYAISLVHECMARTYEEEGDFHNALAQLQTIIDIFEQEESVITWKVFQKNGRERERVVENEPHIAYIQTLMAKIFGKMGDFDRALNLYRSALKIHEKEYEVYRIEINESKILTEMGMLELERKDYAKALDYLEEAKKDHCFSDTVENLILARQMLNWTERYSKLNRGE